jgi:alanine dehydrogenase
VKCAVRVDVLFQLEPLAVGGDAFMKLLGRGAIDRPHIDLYFPCDWEDGYYSWSTMEGANDASMAGQRISALVPE